jgi:predicted transcriptional regulator
MTTPCITVAADAGLEECLRAMEENQVRRVVVCDRDGRVCGIVAQADIAQYALPNQTAEVVREVSQPASN